MIRLVGRLRFIGRLNVYIDDIWRLWRLRFKNVVVLSLEVRRRIEVGITLGFPGS